MSHRPPSAPCTATRARLAPLSRRSILSFGVAVSLGGCNVRTFEDAGQALKFAVVGNPDVVVTRKQILEIPYATIRAKVGTGQRSVLVLFRYDGDDLHWISADRVAFATRRGRLVKTAGLVSNLKNSDFIADDPVVTGLKSLAAPTQVPRLVDIEPGQRYGIPIAATIAPDGEETIEIVERTYDTLRYRERCTAPLLEWEFENLYWADRKNGYVWKSVQHFTPDLPPVEIEILKSAS